MIKQGNNVIHLASGEPGVVARVTRDAAGTVIALVQWTGDTAASPGWFRAQALRRISRTTNLGAVAERRPAVGGGDDRCEECHEAFGLSGEDENGVNATCVHCGNNTFFVEK